LLHPALDSGRSFFPSEPNSLERFAHRARADKFQNLSVRDIHQINLPADVPAGRYALQVGYNTENNRRGIELLEASRL
jgi:hypothetical protein